MRDFQEIRTKMGNNPVGKKGTWVYPKRKLQWPLFTFLR